MCSVCFMCGAGQSWVWQMRRRKSRNYCMSRSNFDFRFDNVKFIILWARCDGLAMVDKSRPRGHWPPSNYFDSQRQCIQMARKKYAWNSERNEQREGVQTAQSTLPKFYFTAVRFTMAFKLMNPKSEGTEEPKATTENEFFKFDVILLSVSLWTHYSLLFVCCFFFFHWHEADLCCCCRRCYGWCTRKKHHKKELVPCALFCSDFSERVSEWMRQRFWFGFFRSSFGHFHIQYGPCCQMLSSVVELNFCVDRHSIYCMRRETQLRCAHGVTGFSHWQSAQCRLNCLPKYTSFGYGQNVMPQR